MPDKSEPRSPFPLLIRCVLENKGDYWQAFTLEFGLAAQASGKQEAKRKLEMMIYSYLYDALVGEDRQYAVQLLSRRASPNVYVKYYVGKVFSSLQRDGEKPAMRHCAYEEPVPLVPVACAA